MANVNDLITLGVGAPGSISHLMLSGLTPSVVSPYQMISLGLGSPASVPYLLLVGLTGRRGGVTGVTVTATYVIEQEVIATYINEQTVIATAAVED